MDLSKLDQSERDQILKNKLSEDIVKIIDRYRLVSTADLKWISNKENSHEHVIFTQKFLLKTDALGALFRINYLCLAKLKYFRENIDRFEPMRYHPEKGFITTDISNSNFMRHIKSGRIIDYRFLQEITDIEVFRGFCERLER